LAQAVEPCGVRIRVRTYGELFLLFAFEPLLLSLLNHATYLFVLAVLARKSETVLLDLLVQLFGHPA